MALHGGFGNAGVPSRHRENKRLLFWFVFQMFSSGIAVAPEAVCSGAVIAVSGLDRSL